MKILLDKQTKTLSRQRKKTYQNAYHKIGNKIALTPAPRFFPISPLFSTVQQCLPFSMQTVLLSFLFRPENDDETYWKCNNSAWCDFVFKFWCFVRQDKRSNFTQSERQRLWGVGKHKKLLPNTLFFPVFNFISFALDTIKPIVIRRFFFLLSSSDLLFSPTQIKRRKKSTRRKRRGKNEQNKLLLNVEGCVCGGDRIHMCSSLAYNRQAVQKQGRLKPLHYRI